MVRKLLIVFLSLLISASAFSDDSVDKLVRQSIYKFERLEAMNNENTRNGNSHLNNYVIELDPNWIEERPTKIILSSNYERLATLLRNFNNGRKDALRFYVVVVNDFKARVNEEANISSRTIANLSEYISMPDKNTEYQRFLTDIKGIPASISAAMKGKYNDRIVYFYGRIGLYKLDQQLKNYRTDFLSLEGDRLGPLDAQLRPMALSNVGTSDAPGNRIEKLVENIINGIQVLIDNGSTPSTVDCSKPLADIISQTASIRAQQYAGVVTGIAGLLNSPESAQQIGGSRYLLAKDPSEFPTDNFTSKILPEKISLLNSNSTHKIYVVFYSVNFAMPASDWPALANAVAQQSGIARQPNNVVVIVPYYQTTCVGQDWLGFPVARGTAMVMPSVYTNDEVLKNSMNTALALSGMSWETNFTHAYSKIPKAHYQFVYAVSYQFYVVDKKTIFRQNATDNKNIYDLHILVDSRLPDHIELLQERKDEALAYGGPASVQRVIDQLTALQARAPTFYQLQHGLKESSLLPTTVAGRTFSPIAEQYLLWFAQKKLSESLVWQENLFQFEGPAPAAPLLAHFKDGYNPQTIEDEFEMLDEAGLVLAPFDLDWITDGAGFLLACRYKDTQKQIIYGAAASAPIVAAYFWRKGAKFFKRANGTFEVTEEFIDETLELWLRTKTRLKENLKWTDDVIAHFEADFATNLEMLRRFDSEPGLVDSWKLLQNAPDGIRTGIKSLTTVSKFADEGIELTFEAILDGARILNKNGDEVGKLLKEGSEEILEISDDFFVSAASSTSKKFDGITVKSNTGETFNNAGFVKNADGSIGFVEDVSSYGSQAVQNAIKQRGALRTSLTGIKSTEDAHHLFPVQSLKENQYVKKGVEGGFEFNSGSVNGIAVEKYVKATGAGRHGPHPKLTKQMEDHMNWWAEQSSVVNGQTILNKNLTPAQTAEYMRVIAEDVKETISTTTTKLNDLDLGLDHF